MEPIKDGLKCWLEGSDLTSSSTNWNDRSGNDNNFSIIGAPVTQNNMAVFSEDWYAKIDNLNINYGTIELTASFSSNAVHDNNYMCGSWEKKNYKYGLGNYRIVIRSKNNNSSTIFNRLLSSDINELKTYGMTFNENTCVIYYEGQIIETIKRTDMPNIITFYLGYKSDSNKKGIGNIKSLKIYDRKLEPYEILANYQYELLNRNTNSYVNENNLPKIVDKLSNASNIKITGNKYGNRVQTVIDKIVEKADDITKAIEQEVVNNSYSFKVGTGDVDVSTDVEDGFGEVGVKGVTYQNCLKFTNDITFNLNLENWNIRVISSDKILVKPNTVYTMIIYVSNVTVSHNELLWVGDVSGNKNSITDEIIRKNVTMGINTFKFTTNSNPEDKAIRFQGSKFVEGVLTFKPLLLEGDHTNNPNLPSYFEEIVGAGDKSKNLFNKDNIKQTVLNLGAVGSNCDEVVSQVRCSLRKISCKPNTKYTIKSDKEISVAIGSIGNNNIALGDSNWRNIYNSYTYTTPSDAIELAVNIAKTDNTNIDIDYVKNFNIQIEEGETSTSYEPYYDGHKIEILSNGKNLTNLEDMPLGNLENSGKVVMSPTSAYKVTPNFIKIEPTRKVCFYYEYDENDTSTPQHNMIAYYDENFSYLGAIYDRPPKGAIVIPHTKAKYIRLRVRKETVKLSLVFSSDIVYEPYQEDKTQILLDEPLMRLPNGVHDEITRDGKLIRRVGKVVLTDIKDWYKALVEEKTIRFAWHGKYDAIYKSKASSHGYCDTVLYHKDNSDDKVHCRINGATPYGSLVFWADKSQLTTETSEGFKQWLSQNPTTVYYELAEPIITELPAPYLRIFKDGHLTFNTLVAPESNHVVQLNKSGQIQNAIKESQSLDNRINVLENNYDNLMLSTISRLNDLELDYTLK